MGPWPLTSINPRASKCHLPLAVALQILRNGCPAAQITGWIDQSAVACLKDVRSTMIGSSPPFTTAVQNALSLRAARC
jgi:hypothetical protein